MLLLAVAFAFDTADPYDRLRGFPNENDDGPADVAPVAYRHGQPESGRAAPRLQIERDTGWTDLAEPAEVIDAGSFGVVRFDPVCADEPTARYRITWGSSGDERDRVEFGVDERVDALEPPALVAAAAFTWTAASDTGGVSPLCGIDFQFAGEAEADSYWEWTNAELSAAGWVLFALDAAGGTVFMEADRTYIANYNGMVEPNQSYAFDVYWVSPQGAWLAAGHVEGESGDCDAVELPVEEIVDSGEPALDESGTEATDGEGCAAAAGCGGAGAAALGMLLAVGARIGGSRVRRGAGRVDSPYVP